MQTLTPIIIHVPHASTLIPSNEWQYFVTNNIQREIICMTDHYCDDLFRCNHEMIKFPISRLICDVERFRDDKDESMSLRGMGVVYEKGIDGTLIKEVPQLHKCEILEKYYDAHHMKLEAAVRRRLERFDKCLIIDGHSFYDKPLPYEFDQKENRPDICIGTDEFHTPDAIRDTLIDLFRCKGYSVEVNSPFAGALVPIQYYQADRRVNSVMIEINRKLYIDEKADKRANYIKVKRDIGEVISEMETLIR